MLKSIIRWAILNSPAMNTFLIALLLVGGISLVVIPREVFPNFELEIVLVTVPFPGATPEEVEKGICQKIEAQFSNLDGVKKVSSVASEGFGYCILELQSYVKDTQKVLNEVRSQIDQISTFPPRSEDPEVKQIIFRAPAITLGLIGPEKSADPEIRLSQDRQLRELAELVREDLLNLPAAPPESFIRQKFSGLFQPSGPAISSAEIVAAKPFEIAVEVPEGTLQEYGLSLSRLANMIRLQNVEIPGGKMETPAEEMLLRGKNKREFGPEIAEIPLMSRPNGDVVTVGDIGVVIDGFEESVSEHVINGRPGLAIRVSKTADEDLFTVVETVRRYAEKKVLPAGYELRLWGDVSVDVKDRVDMLAENGIQGLIVVFVILTLFLDIRLAFWVALGIPVSILGTGLVLIAFGQTLNMLTMFSFLMALGIVVDDAIVISENVFEKRQLGLDPVEASVEGTYEVIPSVFASVTTTIIAFVPLAFVTGVMGKFISVMPLAVIAMLVISLAEAIFVLPGHLAHDKNLFLRMVAGGLYIFRPFLFVIEALNRYFTKALDNFILQVYRPALVWSLGNRRISLAVAISMLIASVGLIIGGVAPFGLFPDMDSREISATVAFPNGTAAEFAKNATIELESAIKRVAERVRVESGEEVIVNLYRKIGEVGDSNRGPTGVTNGGHVATVEVQLVTPEERSVSSKRLIAEWRKEIPRIPGAEVLKFGSQSMGPGGSGIEFKLLANDQSSQFLPAATQRCKEYLASKVGVFDIEDDARLGKSEMVLKLNDLGKALGLDENTLANTIRGSYFGEEVMRLQRGRHEVKLMVRYPRDERTTMKGFESIRVRGSDNLERPLLDVATVDFVRSFSSINRLNQQRSVTITASVKDDEANAAEIIQEMQQDFVPKLVTDFRNQYGASIAVSWEGEQADTMESITSMGIGYVIAMLAMYVLLTLEFRTYIQPVIIMSIIPFGIVGAILGHAILGLNLTLFSFFGLVALSGVIVNDSIVLVDFVNHLHRQGMPMREAVVQAGVRRFRPILLTSLTTVGGLGPILLETSVQAQVLIPMAASLIFGLMTGTFLILILVPIFCTIHGTWMELMARWGIIDESAPHSHGSDVSASATV